MLIALATKYSGDYDCMLADITSRKLEGLEDLERDNRCITILDSDYPKSLKNTVRPPLVLFYKGDITLLNAKDKIAVVGTREPSGEAEMFTDTFISKCVASDRVIVTGLSMGIGATATLSALESGKKVIAVLGSGIDFCWPVCNKDLYERIIAEGGLVISEYPFSTEPLMTHFPARNRIIAALADSVCSMELKQRSGALITINYALSQGKTVYAKPNLFEINDVNNHLIDEGANCLTLSTTI